MILNRQRRVAVALAPLADFLERVRRELRFPENGVTVRLVSEARMAGLNSSFRGKAGSTDVLSFPANGAPAPSRKHGRSRRRVAGFMDKPAAMRVAGFMDKPAAMSAAQGERYYVGDIAIAPETARRNARFYSRNLPEELRILILHGMIHLAGYDHETDGGRMNRLERRLRARLGLKGS